MFCRSDKESYLQSISRDSTQLLINELFSLERESNEEGLFAKLPDYDLSLLPRFKPLPKPKPLTRWEAFAKKRGITKTKKSTKAFDEAVGDWKPKFGYGSKNVESDWLLEVPGNADPMEDQYEKLTKEKKERVEKNKKRQKRNEEESAVLASASVGAKSPLVPGSATANQAIRDMKKKQIEKQLVESKVGSFFFLNFKSSEEMGEINVDCKCDSALHSFIGQV